MAAFYFTVNPSFLGEKGHPITVPRSQVPYRALESEGLNQKNVTIIFPRGERFKGQLYHGRSGWGKYYRLQMRGEDRTLPTYIKLHDRLLVALFKVGALSYAVLEYCE